MGKGKRPSRKDFTLLRDTAGGCDDIFDAEQAAERRKRGTIRGVLRLLALAREEAGVRNECILHAACGRTSLAACRLVTMAPRGLLHVAAIMHTT